MHGHGDNVNQRLTKIENYHFSHSVSPNKINSVNDKHEMSNHFHNLRKTKG